MEVHPPEHAVRSWRDFFIHIATIVVGLLIAIGLEQSVEWFHHRHIVHVARENIMREIEANQKLSFSNKALVEQTKQLMEENRKRVLALKHDPHAFSHGSMQFTFSWSSFADSAWRSSRDTGALAYMPTDEVQQYAEVYGQQQIVSDQAIELFVQEGQGPAPFLMSEDAATMPAEDQRALVSNAVQLFLRLNTLQQMIQGLDRNFAEAEKQAK